MKTDVLKNIKATEEEYQSLISTVMAERKRSLSDAELEADNLVMKASTNAEEYRKMRLAEARQQAERKHAEVIREGERKSSDLKAKGSKNLNSAVELLVSRFKERLHALT
ncbi:MAG: ATPase [Methanomicrobiales archaeon]|jgi:V/A-type H+-transporting ATPase subunit G/H|nr:ATPase [Methanomicrobiales archaeon]